VLNRGGGNAGRVEEWLEPTKMVGFDVVALCRKASASEAQGRRTAGAQHGRSAMGMLHGVIKTEGGTPRCR
jgi:hypothetical protein